jgi:hypothetical protein
MLLSPMLPLLAVLALAPTARAQSDADRETAQVLFKQGNEARAAGDVQAAIAKYKVAYALVQTPVIGVALGKAELDAGLLVEARQTFLSVGRIPVLSNESARAAAARAEVSSLAGQLEPRIATVTLKLHGHPGFARPAVTIDGVAIPDVALEAPRRLNPGDHVAVATVPGAKAETAFHVGVGETKDVGVEVPESPASVGPAPAGAVAVAPVVAPSPSPAPITATSSAAASTGHSRVPAYVAFGVGGAGLVVTAVFGAVALENKSNLNGECSTGHGSCPASAQGNINSFRTNALVSDIGLGVGVVGLALGGVLLLVNRGESSATPPRPGEARAIPWVGLGSAGVRGSF